jgi:hypothetical protein
MSIREIEISDQMFSLSQSDICRLCGLSNSSRFLIYRKVDAAELTIADLINRYLPIQVNMKYTSSFMIKILDYSTN